MSQSDDDLWADSEADNDALFSRDADDDDDDEEY